MRQLSENNLLLFTANFIYNLRGYNGKNQIGLTQLSKGEIGTKLQEFLVNASSQLGFPALDDDNTHDLVQEFYDTYPMTNDWIESTYEKCKKAYKQTKTNKVG